MRKVIIVTAILLITCAGMTSPQEPAPKPAPAPSQFKNLQVLPPTITRTELLNTMKGFTRGLGVRCNHCHVVTATEPKEEFDFPSDAKEHKRNARTMLRMVRTINADFVSKVDEDARVTCWTCHRGHDEPEEPPPPPAPVPATTT